MTSFVATTLAQEVSIPDPGLDAAIRAALQKPFGPLTEQDLLSLTNLDASRRNVKSIVGLETARNLVSLDLQINRLTNFALPSELTKLITLDVSVNPLTNFFLPSRAFALATHRQRFQRRNGRCRARLAGGCGQPRGPGVI